MPADEPPTAPTGDAQGGVVEWVTQRGALARQAAKLRAASTAELELYRRAALALEVGQRVASPVDPLRAGSGAAHALDAFRQSIHWSLALLDGAPERSLEALREAHAAALDEVAPPRAAERVRDLLKSSYVSDAAEATEVQVADAALLGETARGLLARLDSPQRGLEALLRRRARRGFLAAIAAGVALALLFAGLRVALRKPDLALGKPWRASSTWARCEPKKRQCGGIHDTGIFFHTLDDASPWLEIDLGAPKRFSSLTVKNRDDCCGDRAVPLIVEVGPDATTWTEVARQDAEFTTWNPKFAPTEARYVRLRVARKSWLHLAQVAVHP